jgi:hypothetical protein
MSDEIANRLIAQWLPMKDAPDIPILIGLAKSNYKQQTWGRVRLARRLPETKQSFRLEVAGHFRFSKDCLGWMLPPEPPDDFV